MDQQTQEIYISIVQTEISYKQILKLAVSLIEHVAFASRKRACSHFDEEN